MNPSVKVKSLKTNSDNLKIPSQEKGNEGNVGKWYEKVLKEKGFELNPGKGVDLPGLNVENKTRKHGSKAPHTITTMTFNDIINTDYKDSVFAKKMQQQNRMKYDNTFNQVISESVYDFRDPDIQKMLEEDYETNRDFFKNSATQPTGTTIMGDHVIFEHRTSNTYAIRINDEGMKKFEGMAKSTFNDLFEYK